MNRIGSLVCLLAVVCLALGASMGTAAAQWTRIAALPATDVFALRVVGDTITAGIDTVACVSTDGGTTWRRSSKVAPGVTLVSAVLMRNGRLFAGTAGQGVRVSNDLGATWQSFNQGLVGGILNSQLQVSDLERRVNDLLVSTFGAGVYVRNLAAADTWHTFGNVFEPNQAPNVNDLEVGGTRLLACAGGNGTTFHREPADAEWTVDFLVNGQILPGQMAQTSLWTGTRWIVGTNIGVFFSPIGQQPWTPSNTHLVNLGWSAFAQHGETVFAAFDSAGRGLFAESLDQGMNWTIQERANGIFTYRLAVHGDDLYAARSDGLWIRPLESTTSVDPLPSRDLLHFALTRQPVRDAARFRFDLPIAANASIELFDASGRRAGDRIAGVWSAGPHELTVDVHGLRAGVYAARLTAGSLYHTVRLVRLP